RHQGSHRQGNRGREEGRRHLRDRDQRRGQRDRRHGLALRRLLRDGQGEQARRGRQVPRDLGEEERQVADRARYLELERRIRRTRIRTPSGARRGGEEEVAPEWATT